MHVRLPRALACSLARPLTCIVRTAELGSKAASQVRNPNQGIPQHDELINSMDDSWHARKEAYQVAAFAAAKPTLGYVGSGLVTFNRHYCRYLV